MREFLVSLTEVTGASLKAGAKILLITLDEGQQNNTWEPNLSPQPLDRSYDHSRYYFNQIHLNHDLND